MTAKEINNQGQSPDLSVITTSRGRLDELEKIIASGIHGFYEIGSVLIEIQADKLYKSQYKTFEEYCKQRWGMTRDYAYKQIKATRALDNLYTNGIQKATSPLTERNLRPLTDLQPEQQRDVWAGLVNSSQVITEKLVKQAVKEYKRVNNIPDNLNPRTGKAPQFSPIVKPSDNWNFSTVTYNRIDGDESYHGYIPGEIYANCFWYYVKPGDLVVVPMAGSGQAQRVYEAREEWMGSHIYDFDLKMFDLSPRGKYKNLIGEHNLVKSFPINNPDYIIMDVPYYGMVDQQYSDKLEDLANMNLDEWVNALAVIACNCAEAQAFGKRCTAISPNYRDVSTGQIILITDLIRQAWERAGYSMFDKAYATRRIQQAQTPNMARMNNMAKERKTMLTDIAEILTFQRL